MAEVVENPQDGWGMDFGEFWGGDLNSFDFFAMCKRLLWKHLEHQPNIRKMCDLLAELASEADAVVLEEAGRVGIDQAVGEELDEYGKMVNLPRLGAADDLYRRGIKAAARATLCQASPGDYYDIVDVVTPNGSILLLEQFPACIRIYFFDMTPEEQRVVGSLIGLCRGLGICALGVFIDDEVFEWASTEGSVVVEHHWSSTNFGTVPATESAGFASVSPL